MSRTWLWYRRLATVAVVSLILFSGAVSVRYWQDSSRLTALAKELADREQPAYEQMRYLARFVSSLPNARPDTYFMLPVFRSLKPTACQVVDGGGDCAYKARAFIVLSRKLGIEAHKLCLYNSSGSPRHAVAIVETDKGDAIVDLLFGIVYEHEDGTPMSLEYLGDKLEVAIESEVARGNPSAARYPIEDYSYANVSTINWKKGTLWRSCRALLGTVLTKEEIDLLPRPYISEEPALMVLVLNALVAIVVCTPILFLQLTKSVGRIAQRVFSAKTEFN